MEEERFDLKTKILVGIAAVLIVLIGVFGARLLLSGGSDKKSSVLTVPDMRGQTKTQVLAWADENKVPEEQIEFSYTFDEDTDSDVVIDQNLEPDTPLKKETLSLIVSQGPDPEAMFSLPDFVNLSRPEIEEWFQQHYFTRVTYATQESSLPAGTFISMVPNGGMVKRTDEITVVLADETSTPAASSTGKDVAVPDFSTYSRADVTNWGRSNNVVIKFYEEASKTVAKDSVIRQSPGAGSTVNHGDTVTVTFANGLPVTLVSQVGKTKADATSWANTNKLKPAYVDVYGAQPKGNVEYMSPASGIVWEEAQITFGISIGQVPVQDLTGKTLDDAAAYFSTLNSNYSSSANIQYNVSYKEDASPVGTILSQSAGGKKQSGTVNVNPGSSIAIVASGGVTVPNYAGKSEQVLLDGFASLGVDPGTRFEEYSDTVPVGYIIWNESGPTNKYTKVNYTISLGPQYTEEAPPTPAPEETAKPEESSEEKTEEQSQESTEENTEEKTEEAQG